MATAVNHYTSYKARPFTREQRDSTTILFGGLTWKHERLVQGVFNNLNYKAKPLPNITRADLDAGKELIDVGERVVVIARDYGRPEARAAEVEQRKRIELLVSFDGW